MSSLTLMFIRHAEKPSGTFPGNGSNFEGETDPSSLVIRGWQRAGAWAALFGAPQNLIYPAPNYVYAAALPGEKPAEPRESRRPAETAGPLADRFQVPFTTKFSVGDEKSLVKELVKLTGVVVVFWEHHAIAETIIPKLLDGQIVPGVPLEWDGERFDVILRFDRALPEAPWSYQFLAPRLLSQDSDAPFKKLAAFK